MALNPSGPNHPFDPDRWLAFARELVRSCDEVAKIRALAAEKKK